MRMDDLAQVIASECDGLADMLETVAAAQYDHRCAEAARNMRRIAATMHQVDGAVMLDVAMLDLASGGMASSSESAVPPDC